MARSPGAWIEDLAWPEAASRIADGAPILIPIGAAAKEHGHHLPMNTDYLLARGLSEALLGQLAILAAPVIGLGYYPAFAEFAGSQSIDAPTFQATIEQVLERLIDQGATRLALLNTGVSTEAPIALAVAEIYRRRKIRAGVAHLRLLGNAVAHLWQHGGGHADERETSLMLALAPERVDLRRAPAFRAGDPATQIFRRPTILSSDPLRGDEFAPSGATGDPSAATAEKGRTALAAIVAELSAGLRTLFADKLA